ncbi:hypothetical protein NDU88_006753 [Pleurodeles waltl]|uniref:Uncharacterized protein n=1 Tax=Pleurodeles waltl TaxID=8319 RepID=A0AAV7UQK7_PLEWA|nr:hypothetical protein NDU88_006753 [Pleurodeles waltl]
MRVPLSHLETYCCSQAACHVIGLVATHVTFPVFTNTPPCARHLPGDMSSGTCSLPSPGTEAQKRRQKADTPEASRCPR